MLDSVVPELLALGLLHPEDVVRHGLRVEECAGRNRCYRALVGGRPRYFLKQGETESGRFGAREARVEAEIYERVARDPAFAPLAHHVPRLIAADPDRALLVLDDLGPGLSLAERWAPGPPWTPPPLAEPLAAALAACHSVPATALADGAIPARRPWALDAARAFPEALRDLSPAQIEVLRAVQLAPAATEQLAWLRREWRTECLIHGDLKWGNILALPDGGSVALVDWELAGAGDPAWDVGSVLHGYLGECLSTLPFADFRTPGDAAAAFDAATPALRREAGAFVRAYLMLRSAAASDRSFTGRAAGCCAARLVQTAYERCFGRREPSRSAAALLQLGVNLLSRPEAAITLLGLSDGGGVGS